MKLNSSPRNIARTLLCQSQGVALLGRVMTSSDILASAFKVAESEILSSRHFFAIIFDRTF